MNKPQPATPLADRLDKQGVMLTFVPRDAHLSIESAHDRQSPRSINMHVDLEPGQDIRLPNDHSLKTLVWGLHLVESTSFNENAAKEGALGFAIYSEEKKYVDDYFPESCYISAALHPDKFSALLDAIQSGHLPEQIVVTARPQLRMGTGRRRKGLGHQKNARRSCHRNQVYPAAHRPPRRPV